MGYRADEFGRVLQGSFSGEKSPYQCQTIGAYHWRISQTDAAFEVDVRIAEKPPRQIALLALPVLQVEFQLRQTDALLQEQFFSRFFKYFHKGGG